MFDLDHSTDGSGAEAEAELSVSEHAIPSLDGAGKDDHQQVKKCKKASPKSKEKANKTAKPKHQGNCSNCGPTESSKFVKGLCINCYSRDRKSKQRSSEAVVQAAPSPEDENDGENQSKDGTTGPPVDGDVSDRRDYGSSLSPFGSQIAINRNRSLKFSSAARRRSVLSPVSSSSRSASSNRAVPDLCSLKQESIEVPLNGDQSNRTTGQDYQDGGGTSVLSGVSARAPFLAPRRSSSRKRNYTSSSLKDSTAAGREDENDANDGDAHPAKVRKLDNSSTSADSTSLLPRISLDGPQLGHGLENQDGDIAKDKSNELLTGSIDHAISLGITDTGNATPQDAGIIFSNATTTGSAPLAEEQEAIQMVQSTLQSTAPAYTNAITTLKESFHTLLDQFQASHQSRQRAAQSATSNLLTTFGNLQCTRDSLVFELNCLKAEHCNLQSQNEETIKEREEWRAAKILADANIGQLKEEKSNLQEELDRTRLDKDLEIKDLKQKLEGVLQMLGQFNSFMATT